MRAFVVVSLVACGSSRTPESKPVAVPADATAVAPPIDAAIAIDAAPDAAIAAPVVPLPRGVHPVFVKHGYDSAWYLLACSQVIDGQPAKLLGAAACAPLLKGRGYLGQLDALATSGRVPVRFGGASGAGTACPGPSTKKFPTVKIVGLPDGSDAQWIVSRGMAESTAPASQKTLDAILAANKPGPSKSPHPAPWPAAAAQFDLDGDGTFEVVTYDLGWFRIFGQDGKLVGEVGCAFG